MKFIGVIVDKPGSTIKNKTGSWRVFKPILNKKKCIKCNTCILFCPEGCIDENHEINYDYCKGCGICEEECPVNAIKL